MDDIRFGIKRTDTPAWGPAETASIHINGRDLVDLAREAELPSAVRDGQRQLAGSYVGLPVEAVFPPSRRLLGEPEARYDDWGAGSPFSAAAAVTSAAGRFRQGSRPRTTSWSGTTLRNRTGPGGDTTRWGRSPSTESNTKPRSGKTRDPRPSKG